MDNPVGIINQFENKKILVVGDLILDSYLTGKVRRMSPEGIHPLIHVKRVKDKKYYVGGACNVAYNLVDLGAETYLCGVIGEDSSGKKLIEMLLNKEVNTSLVVKDNDRSTTEKERIIGIGTSGPEKIVRIDEEDSHPINEDIQKEILERFSKYLNKFDAVVVSDYKKGFVVKNIVSKLPELARNRLVIVDTKQYDLNIFMKGFRFFKQNQYEIEEITGLNSENLDDLKIKEIGAKLSEIFDYENVVMTCGADGMIIYDKDGNHQHTKAIKSKEPYDVSGAGDTVAAVLSLALSSEADIYNACLIASHAASIVIGKTGTATVSKNELLGSLVNNYNQ